MQLEELIVKAVSGSTREVFSTMLGVEIGPGESFVEVATPEANDGVLGLVGVAGPWNGTGSLICSPHIACKVCSRMLMTDATSIDDEVLDAVAELTNMIIGGAKTELELAIGPLGLSIPTVIYGRNFKTKSAIHGEWVVLRFSWDGEPFEVRLGLARTEKPTHLSVHAPAPAPCAVDV
jgi:chemotaxis protein CheX